MENKKKIILKLILAIVTLVCSYSLVQIGIKDVISPIDEIGAFILCSIFFIILLKMCEFILKKVLNKSNYKFLIVGTFIFALLIIKFHKFEYVCYESKNTIITIEALGEKDSRSLGNEVWINSIQTEREKLNLDLIQLNDGWEFKNGRIVSYENQPNYLEIPIEFKEKLVIELIKHPYSGMVNIKYNEKNIEYNLFSEQENYEQIIIEPSINKLKTEFIRINCMIIIYILSLIICGSMILITKNRINSIFIISIVFLIIKYFFKANSILCIIISIIVGTLLSKTKLDITLIEKKRKKIEIIVICSILSICTIIMFGLVPKYSSDTNILSITALGEKDSLSKGTEVWIDKISVDESRMTLGNLDLPEGWIDKGRVVSYTNQPNQLDVKVNMSNDLNVALVKHPYSGYAKIEFLGHEEIINLYAENEEIYNYKYSIEPQLKFIEYIIAYVSLFFILWLIYMQFIIIFLKNKVHNNRRKLINKKENNDIKRVIFYSIPCMLSWGVYWLGFYPALMSGDSISQWGQAHGYYQLQDGHPIIYTMLIKILSYIWDTPAIVSLFQIICISIVLGNILRYFETKGVSKWILIFCSLIVALIPANGMMVISIWKDIPYSITLVILTFLCMKIFDTKGQILKSNMFLCKVILCMIALILFRHNGIIAIIFTICGGLFLYKKYWKEIILIAIVVIVSVSTIKGPIYDYMRVERFENSIVYPPIHQIGAVLYNNGEISEEYIESLDSIMPIELWKSNYSPYYHDFLIFPTYLNDMGETTNLLSEGSKNKETIMDIWKDILPYNLEIIIKHQLELTSLVWRIKEPIESYTLTTEYRVADNEYGLVTTPIVNKINTILTQLVQFTHSNETLYTILWRPALPLLFIIICSAFLYIIKGKQILFMMLPLMGNIVSLMLAIPAQCYRYLYSNYFILLIILLMLFVNQNTIYTCNDIVE